jgi:hypothetical protein
VRQLLASLAAELERPRVVTEQVIQHLTGTHNVSRDAVGQFLVNELPQLEDYEIDLALSPLFTPTLKDQAVFAELLGRERIPQAQWPELVQQLASRPVRAQLLTGDGSTQRVDLRAVTIERYVYRLRLEGGIPDSVFALVESSPAADRPMFKAIARRAVWESEPRRSILAHYLQAAPSISDRPLPDAVALLKLVETYQPVDLGELLARVPHWQQVLRQEINQGTGVKPFFNERVEELHGGGRDQRRQDDSRLATKQGELDFLARLQQVLGPP